MSNTREALYNELSGTERVVIDGFAITYRASLHGNGYIAMLLGHPNTVQANELPADLAAQIERFLRIYEATLYDLPLETASDRPDGKKDEAAL